MAVSGCIASGATSVRTSSARSALTFPPLTSRAGPARSRCRPRCGAWCLPPPTSACSRKKAAELMLLAEQISATQAAEIGIVNRVVSADHFDAAVGEWAEKLAAKSSCS